MNTLNAKSLRSALIACAALMVLTQFNNCGAYSTPDATANSSLEVTCTSTSCITPTLDNLKIAVNVGGGAEFGVKSGLAEWNLGGDCNEGGYPFNIIVWELYLNGTKVRDSNMTGMAGASTVNSRCVNGRYLLYMNMNPIAGDNVNRVGLNNGVGQPTQYDLYVTIYGQDAQGGALQSNQATGRTHVSLIPL
jgi:hypothetical protein